MTREEVLRILREDVVEASRALLGATLVRGPMRARIVETEAYRGADDPACHAFGRTRMKNMALYSHPGHAYVYFTYGNHWMLNVVALEYGVAGAVLVRAAEPLEGVELMRENRGVQDVRNLLSGPGKLAKAFGIDAADNDLPLFDPEADLQIEPAPQPVRNVVVGPRIGIAEGKGHEIPWRFCDADARDWISRPLPPALRRAR